MKVYWSFLVILFLFLQTKAFWAQVDYEPENSFRVELGLPAPLELATNRPFKDLLHGLINVSVGFQHNLENKATVGFGGKYVLFNVNEFRNNFDLSGTIHLAGAYGRIGYEEFWGNLGLDMGLKVGYMNHFSVTNFCQENLGSPNRTEGGFFEPNISMSLIVGENENSAFNLFNIAYAIHSFRFTPEMVCVDNFPGQTLESLDVRTSYLTFGFGYTYFFGRK
jgi:hypothetical protein